MSKKHHKVFQSLSCIVNVLILASKITRCTSVFAFSSLIGISIGTTSSVSEFKICAIAGGIKN